LFDVSSILDQKTKKNNSSHVLASGDGTAAVLAVWSECHTVP